MQTAGRRVLLPEEKACAKAQEQDPAWCNEGNTGRPLFLVQNERQNKK